MGLMDMLNMGGNGQGGQKFSRTLTKGDFMEGDVLT